MRDIRTASERKVFALKISFSSSFSSPLYIFPLSSNLALYFPRLPRAPDLPVIFSFSTFCTLPPIYCVSPQLSLSPRPFLARFPSPPPHFSSPPPTLAPLYTHFVFPELAHSSHFLCFPFFHSLSPYHPALFYPRSLHFFEPAFPPPRRKVDSPPSTGSLCPLLFVRYFSPLLGVYPLFPGRGYICIYGERPSALALPLSLEFLIV